MLEGSVAPGDLVLVAAQGGPYVSRGEERFVRFPETPKESPGSQGLLFLKHDGRAHVFVAVAARMTVVGETVLPREDLAAVFDESYPSPGKRSLAELRKIVSESLEVVAR